MLSELPLIAEHIASMPKVIMKLIADNKQDLV